MESQKESVRINTRISYKEIKHFNCIERAIESSKIGASFRRWQKSLWISARLKCTPILEDSIALSRQLKYFVSL
jgi:hypothetical protein